VSARLLDRHVVAARLGIAPRTVTDLVARGDLAHVRVGKMLRFTEAAIDAYIARQTRPAKDAPEPVHTAALQALPPIRVRRLM